MSKEKKLALSRTMSGAERLIPELRFPEFNGEWDKKLLNEVCDINPSKTDLPDEFVYIDLESVDAGKLFKINVINLENAPSRAQRLLYKGDIIFQMVRPYQKNNFFFDIDSELKFVASTGYAQLRAYQSEMYLYQYLHSDKFVNRVLSKCTGSNYPAINSSSLSKVKVELPLPQEQQKIASCLSSLDELIAAHKDKLDALKEHKKGLLQNLFPQEGETVPKVRFPEFEGDGEWVEKKLGDVFDSFSGGTPKSTEKRYYGGEIPFIRSAEIGKTSTELFLTNEGLKNSSAKLVKKGDLLIALYGANSGEVAISQINGAINQAIICLRSDYSNKFIGHYFFFKKNWIVTRYIQGGQGNLSGQIIKSVELFFPKKPEQQKIASCLSAVDEVIAAQQEKIEQLQQHKKGLMQGLFPRIEN